MKFATCSLFALLLYGGMAFPQESAWNPESYNPQPSDDDWDLPMPCGGAMTFRRVNVPSSGVLGDKQFYLGSHQTEHGHVEYRRKAWLAGAFANADGSNADGSNADGSNADGSGRHYLIGKYEVTRMQDAAVTGQCPVPDDPDFELPVTEVSWAEAMLFAERYSEWLVNNAADRLPMQEEAFGFLRLPTEAEWEFAARGATRVSRSRFAATTFVPPGNKLDEYVVHDGNSYKELDRIGTLKPNPLGIHDILGNAAEFVLEPFRLDVVGRQHGQAGGFVLRGGSYRTRPSEIRTSHRVESPPVDQHGVRRPKHAGFRLVLVAQALPSLESIQAVREAWEARQRQSSLPVEEVGSQLAEEQEDPVEEARALAEAAPNQEMKRRLENLAAVIARNTVARKEERERAAQESLSNAVFAAWRVMLDMGILERWTRLIEATEDPGRRARHQKKYDENHEVYEFNVRYYLDQLTTIDDDYGDVALPPQARMLKGKYADRGLENVRRITDRVVEHVGWVRDSGPEARDAIVRSLNEMVSSRR